MLFSFKRFFLSVIRIKKEEPCPKDHYQRPERKSMSELKHIHHQSGGKKEHITIFINRKLKRVKRPPCPLPAGEFGIILYTFLHIYKNIS